MRRATFALAALCASAALQAQPVTEAGPGTAAGGLARIEGQIVLCASGRRAETEVLLVDPSEGVRPLPVGPDLRVEADGLAPGRYELHVIVAGCDPAARLLDLTPGARLEFEVTLEQGTAFADTLEIEGRRLSAAEERTASAEAVRVVELDEASVRTADLGEVLARNSGVSVQRTGGLGSGGRLSLNGFSGEQVRFFLDGLPLEFAGFGLGLANVPVNLLERVEVYRGVVPIRFGADALGGAVHLVSPEAEAPRNAQVSLQAGSFGTWRGLLSGSTGAPAGSMGWFLRGHLFGDLAQNDYLIDVEVADELGRLRPARVRRFHDGYRAFGGALQVGVAHAPLADHLSLRVFATSTNKELQHNVVMSVPYGEAGWSELGSGAALRFRHRLLPQDRLTLRADLAYGLRSLHFQDLSEHVYDWFGERVLERRTAGELGGLPIDQRTWQHSALARLNAELLMSDAHALRFAIAPTFVARRGDDLRVDEAQSRDPLQSQRDLFTLAAGMEHEWRMFEGVLEWTGFLKAYQMASAAEEVLPGELLRRQDQAHLSMGAGGGLRWLVGHGLLAKASYELATRLPSPDEIFGDGILVGPNLTLKPEQSHNANLELALRDHETPFGAVRGTVGGFARLADQLIVLMGTDRAFVHQNVYAAHSLGIEAAAGWTAPGGWLALDVNGTWQDFRNASSDGAFASFAGDRIPNRPWLFANATVRLQRSSLFAAGDDASLQAVSRYVHAFYRGWESVGLIDSKQVIPAQLTHSIAASYALAGTPRLTFTAEAQNLLDARTYDFFGAQRPGRAVFFKINAEL